jgi:uncharacterized protein Yka (UPF0111/DUF47 family)
MVFQDVIRVILPKEDHFYDFLERQAKLAHEAAIELQRLGTDDVHDVRKAVHDKEKQADKVAHELEDALAKTFVTPLDREDLHKLSTLLDDIADRAHATASAFDMFSIETPSESATKLMALLVRTTQKLSDLLPSLRNHDWDAIRAARRELKVLEKEGDEIYRSSMRSLFSDTSIDARSLIREKEVIQILEDAVDTCEDVAEYLANLAVKHG